jgi:hypothetical protein
MISQEEPIPCIQPDSPRSSQTDEAESCCNFDIDIPCDDEDNEQIVQDQEQQISVNYADAVVQET